MQFHRFNSLDSSPERRLDYWNNIAGTLVPGMTVDGDPTMRAFWHHARLGNVDVSITGSQSATARLKADRRADELTHVGLAIQVAGTTSLLQRSSSVVLRAGDVALSAIGEYQEFKVSDQNKMFAVGMSAADLGIAPGGLRDLLGTVIPGNRPFVALLRNFIAGMARQQWLEPPTEEETQALSAVLVRLTRVCLEGDRNPAKPVATLHDTIIGFVDKHLFASGLGTGMIAERLSLSPRTIQNVFARMGTTPTAYITEKRLAAAAGILRGGRDFGSITCLAYDLGFSDASYFTRCFKARFGVSPIRYLHHVG